MRKTRTLTSLDAENGVKRQQYSKCCPDHVASHQLVQQVHATNRSALSTHQQFIMHHYYTVALYLSFIRHLNHQVSQL